MVTIMIVIFVLGYLMIASEHVLRINKATFALLMCGLLWATYSLGSHNQDLSYRLIEALGDTCEVVVFLIGAMTIVELIDRYDGFSYITRRIRARNKRKLMWVIALISFFMSAILDNMTTTIIMVMMLRRMISSNRERWKFAGVIIISANSGGAWSPIGDVTTIMLWMKNCVTSLNLIGYLIVPCIVSVVIPVLIASRCVKDEPLEELNDNDKRVGESLSDTHPLISKSILISGVLSLLFVPVFKSITHLPPYMGILISLGVMWLITEIIVNKCDLDKKMDGRISSALRRIDMSTILFFLGILLAVNALQQAHLLSNLAHWLDTNIHEPYTINGIIGVLSSIVDNVPLVAACMNMYPVSTEAIIQASADPVYAQYFIQDGLFWHLLTFCAGVGGSIMIIGSAAGVVAMGIEKISFMWYLKRFSIMAFAGYIAGIATIWLEAWLVIEF